MQQKTSVPVKDEEEDSDIDLFGSDDDEEAAQLKEKRLKEYAEKKAKKPGIIAKSSILLDVKPVSLHTPCVLREPKTMDSPSSRHGTGALI